MMASSSTPAGRLREVTSEADEYSGMRVSADTTLATARLQFRVDANVGDPSSLHRK